MAKNWAISFPFFHNNCKLLRGYPVVGWLDPVAFMKLFSQVRGYLVRWQKRFKKAVFKL